VTIGYAITKADLDNRMGAAVVNLREAFRTCESIFQLLQDTTMLPTSVMTTAPLGYTAGEDTQIRAAFTAIHNLYLFSKNQTTTAMTDFWFDAKHLANLNFNT
jgi:hypothetical protein